MSVSDNRVGRGGSTPKPSPTATPSASPTASGSSSFVDNINARLSGSGLPDLSDLAKNVNISIYSYVDSLTDSQLRTVGGVLYKAGYSARSLRDIRDLLVNDFANVEFPSFAAFVRNVRKELTMFNERDESENIPTRQVYKYDEDVLRDVANNIYLKTRGSIMTDAEWQEQLDTARKKMEAGTLTTTEEVVNKKTGKKERLVTTKPGFTQEGFEADIEKSVKKGSPEEVERRQTFEFNSELLKILAGGL